MSQLNTPTKDSVRDVNQKNTVTPCLSNEHEVQVRRDTFPLSLTKRRLDMENSNHVDSREQQQRRRLSSAQDNIEHDDDYMANESVTSSVTMSQSPPISDITITKRSSISPRSHTTHHDRLSLDETQPFPFSQYSINGAELDDDAIDCYPTTTLYCLRDVATGEVTPLTYRSNEAITKTNSDHARNEQNHVYSIGRSTDAYIICTNPYVRRHHADLVHNITNDTIELRTHDNSCRILLSDTNKWDFIPAGTERKLKIGDTFRMLPYHPTMDKNVQSTKNIYFVLEAIHTQQQNQPTQLQRIGTSAMDYAYIDLLRTIQRDGQPQKNQKGSNITLREPYTLRINLASKQSTTFDTKRTANPDNMDNILPILTLRKLFPVSAILECIWYLRGENHIQFLQRNNQKFWDNQALDNGWVGYNYGLLTNDSNGSTNQLEENVLRPLTDGKCSRNMVCTLCQPNEPTVQQSCTTSIQFAVSKDKQQHNGVERLDLTITQRSSDVILGLPNDIVVWAILLHLVRREVYLRTNHRRVLYPGCIYFIISAGGAHIYDINRHVVDEIISREPISNVQPYLIIDDPTPMEQSLHEQQQFDNNDTTATTANKKGWIFQFARTYDDRKNEIKHPKLRVQGYSNGDYHPRIAIQQALQH